MKQRLLLYVFFFSCCLSFIACKKSTGGGEMGQPSEPIKTGKGVAIGIAVTKTIGPAAGELTSADGKVKMIIPTATVTNTTQFSIQPITNTLHEGDASRVAYRLLPEGTTFTKPVEVVFIYDSHDTGATVEDAMTVAWQQADGSWKIEPTRLDKQAHTITVATTHFSDWTTTGGFELRVEKDVLRPKEKSKLSVMMADNEYLLAPLITPEDEASLTAVGNWKIVEGSGTLDAIRSGRRGFAYSANYTAPSSVNGRLSVVVTMEVEGFNKIKDPSAPGGVRHTGKMILLGRLIVSDNFMIGTMDGVPFGFFGENVVALGLSNAIVVRGSDASGEVSLSVSAAAAGSYPCGQIILPGKAGVSIGPPAGGLTYIHNYFECGQSGELKYSPSSVQITQWPSVGQVAEGSFTGPVYLSDGVCGARQKMLDLRFSVVRGG